MNTVIISDKKLVFPVPNFKIPRMLYGLFYMQYIATPQGSSHKIMQFDTYPKQYYYFYLVLPWPGPHYSYKR